MSSLFPSTPKQLSVWSLFVAALILYQCFHIMIVQSKSKEGSSVALRFLRDFGATTRSSLNDFHVEEYYQDVLDGDSRHHANAAPMVESASGPWPTCMGMSIDKCTAHVTSFAPDCKIHVIYPSDFVFPDHVPERVNLFVNRAGIVNAIPSRG
ncbi:hypothetical protein ACA910_001547 [Epithemia clementina (nom. ined.)]